MMSEKKNLINLEKANTDLLLLGQSPSECSLSFICLNADSIKLEKKYVTSIQKNYTQIGWNFIDNDVAFFNIYKKLVTTLFQFIRDTNFWDLNINLQNYELQKIINSLSYLNTLGITHGYLSFLSNIKYFTSQIQALYSKSDVDSIENRIFNLNSFEESKLYDKPQVSNYLIKNFENILELINSVDTHQISSVDNFFNAPYKMDYSLFHKTFLSDSILKKYYNSKEFQSYRFIMTEIFRILPLFGISLNRRNHLLFLCVKNIEHFYKITWKTQYCESHTFYNNHKILGEK